MTLPKFRSPSLFVPNLKNQISQVFLLFVYLTLIAFLSFFYLFYVLILIFYVLMFYVFVVLRLCFDV